MKTDDLISLLAAGVAPVDRHAVPRRFVLALTLGLAGAAVLTAMMLGFRSDLAEAARLPMFWVKVGVPGVLACLGVVVVERLARPGMRLGRLVLALPVPVLGLWLLAGIVLTTAPPGERMDLVLGSTWRSCPFNIAMIALPLFVALFLALRGLAPTRLALAGAGAGFAAGAMAAGVYAFHCPEMQAPFLAVWYVLGMALPALAGAVLGPWLLRW